MSIQAPSAVVLIRPHFFEPNPATAADNTFQSPAPPERANAIAASARQEVTDVAAALVGRGVTVHLFDDDQPGRPDSVFPNNW
ncbi:MAG TPA: arginine deiminase-related protein, partial [Terrimesophilobacter sp.]|nr:arginine deiminase-related protein [Terrimesophilobacter sp.]